MSGLSFETHLNDGDQRNLSKEEEAAQKPERYDEGKDNSHNLIDSKDERSLANKLGAASKEDKKEKKESDENVRPTQAARDNGNEPSKGAKIDEQIEREEEEYLRNKGKA